MSSILIADDHPIVLHGTRMLLERIGYQVIATCENGIEAYNQLLSLQPAIAVLDVNMPGMNGIEILEKLQGQKCAPVLLCSPCNPNPLFSQGPGTGSQGLFTKRICYG